jgi:hypothetical protein
MKVFPSWLFEANQFTQRREVLRWWFDRLVFFNVAVGITGFLTWWSVMIAGSAAVKPGVDFEEPLAMIFGPFVYAGLANICYCLGPLFDFAFFAGRPRIPLFKIGLGFSVLLTALPGVWAVIAWLITVHTGQKMD